MEYSSFNKKTGIALLVMLLIVGLAVAFLVLTYHEHDFVIEQDVAATCTTDGYRYGVCECGEILNEVLPATGHTIEVISGYDSSCTEPGLKKYENCTVCDYTTFTTDHIIAAKGHVCEDPEEIITKPVTCTEDGAYELVKVCDVCDEEYFREEYPIYHEGHKYVTVDAKAATCLPGYYEYQQCENCPVRLGYEEIPAAYEHISSIYPIVYGPSVVAPTCTEDGSYKMAVCCTNDNCPYLFGELSGPYPIEALGHEEVNHSAKAPTCTEFGWDAYVTCSRCDYTTYAKKTALGHDYIDHEAKAETCTDIGWYAYKTCSRCDYSTYEEIEPHDHDWGDFVVENLILPTCVESGSYDRVIYCAECGIELKREKWEVEPVDHNELSSVEAKEPTCTESGWAAYDRCAKCGAAEVIVEMPALGHAHVDDEAVPATCTESGLTAGYHCERCTEYFKAQEVVLALGHSFSDITGKCINTGCSEFVYSAGLKYTTNADGTLTVAGIGSCNDVDVIIPSQLDGAIVVAIADEAFNNNNNIKSVVIPDTVEVIGEDAFRHCDNLTTVAIGSGVKIVEKGAFNYSPISTVYYTGAAAQWNAISIGKNNDNLTGANRQYI